MFISRSTLLHLRIPFSLFLLPIFTFAVAVSPPGYELSRLALVFVILHLFIYPASNAYNSYMDRDEGPIGSLEHPPPVTRQLYWVSLVLDVVGVLLGLLLDTTFALLLIGYTLISRAYSWRGLRLKKYPWLSTLVVALFQGGYTVLTVEQGLAGWTWHDLFGGFWPGFGWTLLAATLLVGGSYPLTQVYQHSEDAARGDRTISLLLGLRGTFIFCATVLGIGGAVLLGYLYSYRSFTDVLIVGSALLPVLAHFNWWALRVWRDPGEASYRNAMRQNLISGIALTAAFIAITPAPIWA
jgi:1,4-dihydroxy-2-naphthoate octaprenyltransferase